MEFLLKFGKKEHLEQLKNGIVHFSPIELFQEDVTTFRGDKMEGKEYLNLSKPFVVNGVDISAYIEKQLFRVYRIVRYAPSRLLCYRIRIATWYLKTLMR